MSDAGSERLAFCVSVFGKHPAWADHIEDIPLRTPHLARVRELFYERGIRKVFDEGLIASLPESHRLAGFHHLALWEIDGAVVLMRLLRSTDAGGRSAYPLILCVQAPRPYLSTLLDDGARLLDDLARDLEQMRDAEAVRARVEQADASWRALIADRTPDDPPARTVSASLAESMADDHTPLHRILFQMEREMASFVVTPATRSRKEHAPPRHIRLPRRHDDPRSDLRDWLGFLREHLVSGVPVLVAAPLGEDYCDAIVGEADPPSLASLLITRQAHKPASEVAYELDDAFIERAEAALARPIEEMDKGPAGLDRLRGAASSITQRRTEGAGRGSSRRMLIVIVAILILLGLVAAVVLLQGGGASSGKSAGAGGGRTQMPAPSEESIENEPMPSRSSREPAGADGDPSIADTDLDPWRAWVLAWDGWAVDLARMERDGTLPPGIASDAALMDGLVRPVSQMVQTHDFRTSELRRSPRRVEPAASLADSPPEEARSSDAIARAQEVAHALDRWRGVLEAWVPRRQAARAADALRDVGIEHEGIAALARVPDLTPTDGQSDLLAWISRVRENSGRLGGIERAARVIRRLLDEPDPEGFWAGNTLLKAIRDQAPATDIGGLAALLEEGGGLVERIRMARRDVWLSVDRDRWMQVHGDLVGEPKDASLEQVEALLAAITDPEVQIPSGADPRVEGEGNSRLRAGVAKVLAGLDDLAERLDDPDALAWIAEARERIAALEPEITELESLPWVRVHEREIHIRTSAMLEKIQKIDAQRYVLDAEAQAALAGAVEEVRSRVPVGGSRPVQDAWARWSEQSCMRAQQQGPSAPLGDWIDTLERTLRDVEAQIPAWEGAIPAGFDGDAIRQALSSDRSARLERVLELGQWDGSGFENAEEIREMLTREGAARRDLLDEVRTIMDDLVRRHAAMLEGTDDAQEVGGEGQAWAIVRSAGGRVVADLRDMQKVRQTTDREALLDLAGDEGLWAAARCEALQRAFERGLDRDGLVRALDLRDGLLGWARAEAPGRGEDLVRASARAWGRLAGACPDRASLARLADLRNRVDVGFAGLGARERFNLGVITIGRALEMGEDPLGTARDVLDALAEDRGSLGDDARRWLGELDGLVARGGAPGLDRLGPAAVGWKASTSDDGTRVVFERDGERISFRMIGDGVFLQEQELSLGALIAQMRGRWGEIRGLSLIHI